jgi:ferredoxin-type protein NapH
MIALRAKTAGWTARLKTQLVALVALNSYFWAPAGKYLCLPVLNCYACSLATTACPIGSLSAFALAQQAPYYLVGGLGLAGVTVGRAFCGWACPFGFLQDLLHRLPTRKRRLPRGANALKYALLLLLVVGAPWALGGGAERTGADRVVKQSTGALDYCALICPAGTLEAGVPGLVINPAIRKDMSWKSWLKLALLVGILALAVVSRRSFCRSLCPLGAIMAVTSRVSALRLETDRSGCTRCGECVAACPTGARLVPATGGKEATAECLNCLDCVSACPEPAALCAKLVGRTVATSGPRERARETVHAA